MTKTGEIELVNSGMMEILSIGRGDIKINIGCDTQEERDEAAKLITELMQKGYGVFVETDTGLARVHSFNPQRMTYVIKEVEPEPEPQPAAAKKRGRRVKDKEVPVAEAKAKAIGRSAGG